MIIIPMAGLSSRFTRAGYDRPKWMLPLGRRPLFDWSVLGFSQYFETQTFLFIHLDRPGVADFVKERCGALGIRSYELVALQNPTLGQADTVRLGIDLAGVAGDEPLSIFNIDTIRPNILPLIYDGLAGWLETFPGEGSHWSFVLEDARRPHLAARVVEKQRISGNCCTGLYSFASAEIFRWALAQEESAPSMPELYVAPLYQRLIDAGHDVGFGMISKEDVFFSGTPEEYLEALRIEAQIVSAFENK